MQHMPFIPMVERCSASRCLTRMVKGLHRFTLENYSLCKGVGQGQPIDSNSFTVGGHQWVVTIFPDGTAYDSIDGGDRYEEGHVYVGLHVSLMSESDGVRCFFKTTLLDQSGKENHLTTSLFGHVTGPALIATHQYVGFPCFIERDFLEKSSYLKDDCLKIECTVGVVLPSETEVMTPSIVVPQCDDVGVDFLAMLETGEGSDIVFNVRGKKFHAHKVILSARSSVFEFMFASLYQQEMVITNVEPQVFKALLHFIYSDSLPEDESSLTAGYAFGPSVSSTFVAKLLAAANEYDVSRLKRICESHIWRSISLSRFGEILSLAEKYNASVLKHLCFKYAADNYAVLVKLDSFTYLRKNCPLLLNEVEDYISKERLIKNFQADKSPSAKLKEENEEKCN
ncbi:hypothetical protein Pfo_010976 [Paulownia fortunei]|nr:hypothetical protein Pfo_010976 [Paulownia fortunei]